MSNLVSDYGYLLVPVVSWLLAQAIKFVLTLHRDGLNLNDLFASGGMPSSHTAFVSSLTALVGLENGWSSPVFAVSAVLLAVIMYDAVGVRRTTGVNARNIAQIVDRLKLKDQVDLPKTIARGHTLQQVIGGLMLGLVVGFVYHQIF